MKTSATRIAVAFAVGACFAPFGASAFDSGSTGVNGAFNPTVTTTVDVPESGVFNYTTVTIPAGVTVFYRRNATNTPVVILATSNVTIAGSINLNGGAGTPVGAASGGAIGDDGAPGAGGAGGFDGGRGGSVGAFASVPTGQNATLGGSGLGPGGGGPGGPSSNNCGVRVTGGAGGGFGANGESSGNFQNGCGGGINFNGAGGAPYGSSSLLPLIGGSGGGGGSGGQNFVGGGGGGGGGAILIAASGTVNIPTGGSVQANGGKGGDSQGAGYGGPGGGGSGGAIRIVATVLTGEGTISAQGGTRGSDLGGGGLYGADGAGIGAVGRVKLEADTFQRQAAATPPNPTGAVTPGPVFVAGTPTLRIAAVGGTPAPAAPTGVADITLPSSTTNPVVVQLETSGVPVGNIVQVTVLPAGATPRSVVVSPALTGTTASATASVNVTLPTGPSTLMAQTTYTVVAAVGDLLKNFAGNERVEKVTLMATLGGPSMAKLTTVSGKEYEVPADVLRIAALGG